MSNISRKNVIINCELTYQGGIFVTKTIEQLWSGTLEHKMKLEENNAELKELKNLINRNGEHLSETFNEKEKEIFEKYNDCVTEYIDIFGEQAFCSGFCLGAKITTEALTEQNEII